MAKLTRLERWLGDLTGGRLAGREPLPLVTLAYAQSLDGSIAARRDQMMGLSGPQAMRLTHRLRAAHDAILVGIGTVLVDDPRLTVRLVDGNNPQPVILDSHLRLPLEAALWSHPKAPWIATLEKAPTQRFSQLDQAGARLITLEADVEGRVPLDALLAQLAALGIKRLMVEGGARVLTSFLKLGLADWVFVTIAPIYLGGLPVVEERLERRMVSMNVERCGEDVIVWGRMR